jgi:hypothetical protein
MKKSRMVFVALVAMFAFGALTVESASAVTFLLALWLAKGVAVTAPLTAEAEGELTLEDSAAGAAVLCSGILDGWVGPESLDEISEVLELVTHNLISKTQLVEPGLVCTNLKSCEEPLVWADELPWQTEAELVEDVGGPFFAVLILPHPGGGNIGWHIACMKNIIGTEDLCSAPEGVAQLTLEGATLLASFSEAFRELTEVKPATCTLFGGETGLVISDTPFGAFRLVNGEELTASSETSEA